VVRVRSIRRIDAPPFDDPVEQEFSAPCGEASLRFYDPEEFAMGAESWSVSLTRADRVVREWSWCAGDPSALEPWCYDGSKFAFHLASRAGSGVLAASAAGEELPAPSWPSEEFLITLQWAPRIARLILLGPRRVVLLDADFREVAIHNWPPADRPRAFAAWLTRENVFFVVSPDSRLRFFAGTDGSVLGEDVLDPAVVLPLRAPIPEHKRDTYSLAIGPGLTAVGRLLDTWVQARYDAGTEELLLMTYRPLDEMPTRKGGEIPVEECWVAVDFE
jgi:hypothetical protein